MGKPVAGLWAVMENNQEVWRYLTVNGYAFQRAERGNMVCWERMRVPAAARSSIAALMQAQGGGRIDPEDTTAYEAAVRELGGLPDMVRCGYMDPSDNDAADGWKRDQYGGCYRVVDDEAECLAGFLGCEPDEVERVWADATGGPTAATMEIPEVPAPPAAASRVVRVSPEVIPVGVAAREYAGFAGMPKRPRGFRDPRGRKRVYVCFDGARCVVAVREGYAWGSDAALESEVRAYLDRFGWQLAA